MMTRATSFLALLAALSHPVLAQQPCPPEDRVKAVALVKQGLARMDAREYGLAAEDFRSAYAICPEPVVRMYLGRAIEGTGRLDEAVTAFQACEREADSDDLRQRCGARAREVEARIRTGALVVDASPETAMVYLDGANVGQPCGAPIPLTAGRHDVEVRADGYLAYRTVVDVRGGTSATRLDVRLEKVPAPPRPAPDTTWNWVGVVGGGAIAATGIVFLGIDIKDRVDAADCPAGYKCSVSPRNLAIAIPSIFVGVGVVAASWALWPKARVSVAPWGHGCAVEVRASF